MPFEARTSRYMDAMSRNFVRQLSPAVFILVRSQLQMCYCVYPDGRHTHCPGKASPSVGTQAEIPELACTMKLQIFFNFQQAKMCFICLIWIYCDVQGSRRMKGADHRLFDRPEGGRSISWSLVSLDLAERSSREKGVDSSRITAASHSVPTQLQNQCSAITFQTHSDESKPQDTPRKLERNWRDLVLRRRSVSSPTRGTEIMRSTDE
jgi:hypothetical protein